MPIDLEAELASDMEKFNDALQVIKGIVATRPDDLAELCGSEPLYPELIGQFLMDTMSTEEFDERQKRYWMEVAFHMGPDWLEALRVRVAFMQKVDSFR